MSRTQVSELCGGKMIHDSAAIAVGGVFLVTHEKETNTLRIWDIVRNIVVGEIKIDSVHLPDCNFYERCDFALIPNHGFLVTTRKELTLWEIDGGLGERIHLDNNETPCAMVAVDNFNNKLVCGPVVFDVNSTRKIGTLSGWSDNNIRQRFVNHGFTFDDKYYVVFTPFGVFTWDMESYMMVGRLSTAIFFDTVSVASYLKMGLCSSLCMHETQGVLHVWDIAEQKFNCSMKIMIGCSNPFFGPDDSISMVEIKEDLKSCALCVWDPSTTSFHTKFNFNTMGVLWTRYFDFPVLNLMNGKVIAGVHRHDDDTITMIELDWNTNEVVYTKTAIRFRDVMKTIVVLPLSVLM